MTPAQLKSSILQLAIQGKLVPQIPAEGTGEALYQQIQKEKQALIKAGKIKKEKPLPPIAEDEIPFEIPEGWRWCRWGDLSESIQYGYNAPAKSTGRIRMVRISDIQDGNVLWESVPFCEINESEIDTYRLQARDILFARTGGTVGKSFLVRSTPYDSIYAGYLIRTRYSNSLSAEYMKYFMESQLYWEQLRNGTIATAQPNCNGKTLSKMILPLPPLAEQRRIVAKIEELMPLVDRYDKAWTQLEALNKKFPGDLKKSILQEAIQGKLVPQIPSEGTGEALYQQIQKEKQALIKAGKIKKEKPLPPINDDELPFEIPDSWRWCRLKNIANTIVDCPHSTPKYLNIPTDYCAIDTNCINASGEITHWRYVDKTTYIERTQRLVPIVGDIVYTREGSICRAVVLPNNEYMCLGQRVMLIRTIIDKKYLQHTLMSQCVIQLLTSQQKGIGAKHINVSDVCNLLIPLPPLAEQRRIVAKIEELMPLIDRLNTADSK